MATSEPPEEGTTGAPDSQSGQLTQITRAMVWIYKEQFGRGPRHAHSHYTGPNAITCFLEGTLTPLERGLAAAGEQQRLRDMRLWFQYSAEDAFREAVEAITGRQVIAFISGIDVGVDVSLETFCFSPVGASDT